MSNSLLRRFDKNLGILPAGTVGRRNAYSKGDEQRKRKENQEVKAQKSNLNLL